LCLAMAALAVQVTAEEWGRAGVIHWLGQELGSQPEAIPVLLELLAVFPQVSRTSVNILSWLNDIWSLV
jgi:transportin-3